MIGWIVALALYFLGARGMWTSGKDDAYDELEPHQVAMVVLGWPVFEIMDIFGIGDDSEED